VSEYIELRQQISGCTLCDLSNGRTNTVPGEGAVDADIMFIGEAPGSNEDRDGRPFIGQAGKLLDEMLGKIGLDRKDVYVTNMVKCRPPSNRDPALTELSACAPYLDKQIELISPRVIVCLGRFSFSKFFPGEAISKARGTPRDWKNIKIYPMYHPAAALHNPRLKPAIEKDFRNLPALIEQVNQAFQNQPEPEQPQSRQLSMFE
jgi:DNA polymerase